MNLKDYYDILEVEKSASVSDIKKSFRKLAQKFHPDKNQSDPYATAQFHEIKEAYEVLTNPTKKEAYLQQRWYNQSIAKRKTQGVITPVTIFKQLLELEKHISTIDVFRMDKPGLEQYMLEILSTENINQLKQFKEPEIIAQIVEISLKTINSLPRKYSEKTIHQLSKFAEDNEIVKQQLASFTLKANRKFFKEKYTLFFIFCITIILCLLIFWAAK